MTTETTTETQQPTPTTAPGSTTWYVPSTAEFTAMTPEERTAALARSVAERAAYEAQQGHAAQRAATPQEQALDQQGRDIRTELHRLAQAEGAYTRGHKALFRGDGSPIYAEKEHAERLTSLQATLGTVLDAAQTTIGAAITAQQALLAHVETADPLDALSAQDAATANARLVFIKEDAERLPADALLQRCRVALESGDKATQYLLSRYVAQRVENLSRELREGLPPSKADMTTEQRMALLDVTTALRGAVRGPQGTRITEAAHSALASAQEARAKTVAVYDAVFQSKAKVEADLRATGRYSM